MELQHIRQRGLSPRVRGNPQPGYQPDAGRRSIPACAGEPAQQRRPAPQPGVYPRVCGGTALIADDIPAVRGLSPRVRGNLRIFEYGFPVPGSIPACAGEPVAPSISSRAAGVYPRVCGGTERPPRPVGARQGLSPRVRGNRSRPAAAGAASGSIPACAGEPGAPGALRRRSRVYPRVCGGTPQDGGGQVKLQGLSPRVRGNRRLAADSDTVAGSIPACAGEPPASTPKPTPGTVYPRVCGGTAAARGYPAAGRGLSPRVRGNPTPPQFRPAAARSIPACAGEPWPAAARAAPARGLSPRVRGNPRSGLGRGRRRGSIPACAGEPVRGSGCGRWDTVYPRVCGGTVGPQASGCRA